MHTCFRSKPAMSGSECMASTSGIFPRYSLVLRATHTNTSFFAARLLCERQRVTDDSTSGGFRLR